MFQTGGFPDLDLSFLFCPFLSFWDFPGDFPDLLGDGPGIFPICPFPLSRPIKSTYEEQSRKGPRHNLDLPRKKVGNPLVWKPPGLASTKIRSHGPKRSFGPFWTIFSRLSEELQSLLSRTYPSGPDPLRTPPPGPDSDLILT